MYRPMLYKTASPHGKKFPHQKYFNKFVFSNFIKTKYRIFLTTNCLLPNSIKMGKQFTIHFWFFIPSPGSPNSNPFSFCCIIWILYYIGVEKNLWFFSTICKSTLLSTAKFAKLPKKLNFFCLLNTDCGNLTTELRKC